MKSLREVYQDQILNATLRAAVKVLDEQYVPNSNRFALVSEEFRRIKEKQK